MKHALSDSQLEITLEENLVSTTVQEMRLTLQELFNQNPKVPIVLNISKTEVIDSQGLNLLIGIYKECKKRNLRFQVSGCSDANRRLFTIFKLKELFNIESANKS